jgi:hypothetical protein
MLGRPFLGSLKMTTSTPHTRVYLAGKVPKGSEIGQLPDWRAEYISALSVLPALEFASPDDPNLDESDPVGVFGHDCYLIQNSDLIVVNAADRLGVGTAQELLIAKYFFKPVFTVLPHGSPHRRKDLLAGRGIVADWQHPFIVASSDKVFASVQELVKHMATWQRDAPCKSLQIIHDAINHYVQGDEVR